MTAAVRINQAKPTRPVLRWHGGKWKLAPWIISHFPAHRVYVEPFGGAASVLLRKDRSYAEVYNDLDDDVVNLFGVLQSPEGSRRLHEQIEITPFARREFEQAYEPTVDHVERARRLIIRSFMGHGSNGHARATGFRSNSNRSGTTPAHDWVNYPDALALVIERFRGVVIENRKAMDLLPTHDGAETLFYVDPPYVASTRDRGADYRHEMNEAQHGALLQALWDVEGMVVLSGYPHSMYDSMLQGWQRVEVPALADGARERTEVLWINPQCAKALDAQQAQRSLFAAE